MLSGAYVAVSTPVRVYRYHMRHACGSLSLSVQTAVQHLPRVAGNEKRRKRAKRASTQYNLTPQRESSGRPCVFSESEKFGRRVVVSASSITTVLAESHVRGNVHILKDPLYKEVRD